MRVSAHLRMDMCLYVVGAKVEALQNKVQVLTERLEAALAAASEVKSSEVFSAHLFISETFMTCFHIRFRCLSFDKARSGLRHLRCSTFLLVIEVLDLVSCD